MVVDSEANLDRKFVLTMKLLNIYLNHFPSHERHGLALRIRNTAYEMYDYVIEAQKALTFVVTAHGCQLDLSESTACIKLARQ